MAFGWTAQVRTTGFAIEQRSSSRLGTAFSGNTAAAADITHMLSDPARLTRQHGRQVVGVANIIIPVTNFKNGTTSTTSIVGNAPISGGSGDDIGSGRFEQSVDILTLQARYRF